MADETKNDPTIRRCIRFAQDWGFGRLIVANLFAFCATHPKDLKASDDPVGPDNDRQLQQIFETVDQRVFAWGNDGAFANRAEKVIGMPGEAYCLRINASGQPAHPLYLPARLRPMRFRAG